MSYSIITYGFGPNGSVNVIPIYGFSTNPIIYTVPVVDIELDVTIARTITLILNKNLVLDLK